MASKIIISKYLESTRIQERERGKFIWLEHRTMIVCRLLTLTPRNAFTEDESPTIYFSVFSQKQKPRGQSKKRKKEKRRRIEKKKKCAYRISFELGCHRNAFILFLRKLSATHYSEIPTVKHYTVEHLNCIM